MKSTVIVLAVMTGILGAGFSYKASQEPWPVPENYKTMKNPVASNAESIAEGKALWGTHCKSCHGTKGMGDGPKGTAKNRSR
jgi:cytochrome c5